MMRRAMRWTGVPVLLAMILTTAVTSAQTVNPPTKPVPVGPGPIVPPPPVKQKPSMYVMQRARNEQGRFATFPFDFQFADELFGYGFPPGEQVTVTARNVSVPSQTTTVDENGGFRVPMNFTWEFCGPSAKSQPAPTFHAAGNKGTTADATAYAPPCPYLMAAPHYTAPLPESGSGTGSVSVGTVTGTGTGNVVPPTGAPPPTGSLPQPSTPPAPTPATLDVNGFGFQPFEVVSVQSIGPEGKVDGAVIHLSADKEGRIQTHVQAHFPPICSPHYTIPQVTAMGDKGTTVTTRVFWIMPMIACPVKVGAPGDTGPPSGPPANNPPSSGPPADNPPVPSPSAPTPPATGAMSVDATAQAAMLSMSLHAATVKRGHMERALIGADGAGTFDLTVKYHGGRTFHRAVTSTAPGPLTVSWRVSKSAKTGNARVTVTSRTSKVSIQAMFRVK